MDSGKYINAYVETISGTLHEYLNNILQLKAQLKIAEEMIGEKDAALQSMSNQLLERDIADVELGKLRTQLDQVSNENTTLRNKASQVDTFTDQIRQMKEMIRERDDTIQRLQKKPINKKNIVPAIQPPEIKDDF